MQVLFLKLNALICKRQVEYRTVWIACQQKYSQMDSIGYRIKEERLRIGLTQEQLVKQTDVTVQSQRRYESDQRKPDTNYLQALASLGMDVYYILLGRREDEPSRMTVQPDERALINAYQSLDDEGKRSLRGVADAMSLKTLNEGNNKSVRKKPKE